MNSGSDGRIRAALEAIREVASLDPDRARLANAAGFSVADVSLGHRLARLSANHVRNDPVVTNQVLSLAARYRRQVSPKLRYDLRLTDQLDLFG